MDFIETVLGPEQDRHIDFLTIHPRTRQTPSSTPINLEALEILTSKYGDRVPILLSGDVFAMNSLPFTSPLWSQTTRGNEQATDPVKAIPHLPKLAGLMSARAILANPGLYAGNDACTWDVVETFMNKLARAPLPLKLVLHHLSEMCAPGLSPNKESLLSKKERIAMLECTNMVDLIDFLDEKIGDRNGHWGLRRDR